MTPSALQQYLLQILFPDPCLPVGYHGTKEESYVSQSDGQFEHDHNSMVIITQLIYINLSQDQAKYSRILSAVGKNSEMPSKRGLFLNFKCIHQVQYC